VWGFGGTANCTDKRRLFDAIVRDSLQLYVVARSLPLTRSLFTPLCAIHSLASALIPLAPTPFSASPT
jgi:hypothetical protein